MKDIDILRTTGTITNYFPDRGFGFILADVPDADMYPSDFPKAMKDGKKSVFFHSSRSQIQEDDLKPGVRVYLEARETKKGLSAILVKEAE